MSTSVTYQNSDSILESLILHTVPDFGENGDGIINQNMLFAYMKQKGQIDVVDGGIEFWVGLVKEENSNFKWQSHLADMSSNLQDPLIRLAYEQCTFTGSLVVNKLHEAQNKGKAAIKQWAKTLRSQADSTIKNQFNSAFWKGTPGAGEPNSVPSLISATPTTGSIGGQTRSTNAALQNTAYTTAVSDIGAEAGIAALDTHVMSTAITNGDKVDLVVIGANLYSGLAAYLNTLLRYRPNEMMKSQNFDAIDLNGYTVGWEPTSVAGGNNSITSKYVYGINTKYMYLKVLRDGNFSWEKEFRNIGNSLNRALFFYVFCNLCTNLPKAHFVMTDVSTS